FALVAGEGGYQLFLPEGDGGLISEPFALDGIPVNLSMQPVDAAPAETVPMRDVVARRSELGVVTAVLPDGSGIRSSGLRSVAEVDSDYEHEEEGSLLNSEGGTRLVPDHDVGFYRNDAGQTVAPGWRVNVGWANFQRVLFSEGIRQPMLEIFLWTV